MRILLVRTSALGDVIHCLPVLTALHRHLPDAEIAWVGPVGFYARTAGAAVSRVFRRLARSGRVGPN